MTQENNKAKETETQKVKLEEPPEPDAYSKLVAKNPWMVWTISLIIMLLFFLLGTAIAFTAKEFTLSGPSVGFDNRGTALAGQEISKAHISRQECFGNLMVNADGNRSQIFADSVYVQHEDPARLTEDMCYVGYTDDSRRRRLHEHSEIELQTWGEDGAKYDPELISSSNAWDILSGFKNGLTVLFKGSDLLSYESLRGMCTIDKTIRSTFDNFGSYCLYPSYSATCRPSRSLPNYFAALANVSSCETLTESDVNHVKLMLTQCRPHYVYKNLVGNCWNYDSGNNGTYTSKYATNSKYPACVLDEVDHECARYNAVYDIFYSLVPQNFWSNGEQALTLAQAILPAADDGEMLERWEDDMEPFIGTSVGGAEVEVVYISGLKSGLFNANMMNEAPGFAALVCLIYLLVLYHTGSFWITTCGIFQIIFAFLWGWVFYVVLCWRNFFPFLNFIAGFLILGIGADDIFVYIDAWRQSFTKLPEDTPLDSRLSWVLRRAGGAMMVTTLTTSVSFLANISSPISVMKAFGLFTATVVTADYLLMLIFLPPTVALHHLHFSKVAAIIQMENNNNGVLRLTNKSDQVLAVATEDDVVEEDVEMMIVAGEEVIKIAGVVVHDDGTDTDTGGENGSTVTGDYAMHDDNDGHRHHDTERILQSNHDCRCQSCLCCVSKLDIDFCAVPLEVDKETGAYKQRWSESLFQNIVSPILLHRFGRWVFVSVCLGLSVWLMTKALKLSRPSSAYMQLLWGDHPIEIYQKTQQDKFDIGDGNNFDAPYSFIFGLEAVDNGDSFDPFDRGTPQYTEIDISSSEAQKYLLDFCDYISSWDYSPQTESNLEINPCTISWFKFWMEHDCSLTGPEGSGDMLARYPEREAGNCCDKVDQDFPYSSTEFNTCISEFANYWGSRNYHHGLWFDDQGNLKVLFLYGASTEKYSYVFEKTDVLYQNLISFFNDRASVLGDVPSGSGLSGWATTEIRFYSLQKAIVEGAIQSAILSTIFALSILICLTKRVLSSIFVAFQISCVVVSVLGVFVLLGWELNVIESIITAVSVGLACDFAAHLAHSFNDEKPETLESQTPLVMPRSASELIQQMNLSAAKATNAITNLGVTITMGFLSTFLAGIILLSGRLYFFQQFGIFMACLMAFSFVYAFSMLMPLLATFGWVDRITAHSANKHLIAPLRKMYFDNNSNIAEKLKEDDEDEIRTDSSPSP